MPNLLILDLINTSLPNAVGKKYDISVTATENKNFSNAIADLCIQINETKTNSNNIRTDAGGTI